MVHVDLFDRPMGRVSGDMRWTAARFLLENIEKKAACFYAVSIRSNKHEANALEKRKHQAGSTVWAAL